MTATDPFSPVENIYLSNGTLLQVWGGCVDILHGDDYDVGYITFEELGEVINVLRRIKRKIDNLPHPDQKSLGL